MNKDHAMVNDGRVSQENSAFYTAYGFLVADALLSVEEINALRKETIAIFRGERGHVEGLVAINKDESAEDILKKYVAIHFPHKISTVIRDSLFHERITGILSNIVSPNLKCMQSMLFVKGPGKAGQSWHQDEYYIPTRDRSLIGAWIAIDDATVENGCLWIIPGRPGFIMPRVKNDNNEYADVDTVDVTAYSDQMIPVEVRSGAVVFFNGYTLHSSRRNKTTDCFRTALVNHYMSAESMLPWDQDGKLPPTEDLRDIILVAGEDPYAWKGITDVNQPYLRPEILRIKANDL
ncbi:MAG: phytanoyl-CoA dioxygenase family protein [Chitinophaga sp.]|uniref:phytanoyl-CoA dioxygenase family protein n=1 Tax=Chitinophaga sp. TaxID=1869181 RepID=UPI001B279AEE|nr:phytanoyl-CoA dioxygenase family protein [Chitinophaga sp.]MBO9732410.1 phytanoyl-CoA dioxygenase family protein [Chitinophaga sp.]